MQRACAAALLARGDTIIHNASLSNDDLAALDIIQKLGATVEYISDDSIRIKSKGVLPRDHVINCGESGLSSRMFTPIAALASQSVTITGEGSLMSRPMDFFETTLPALGVSVSSPNGRLPLQVQGPLKPADITIDGSLSSQFLTGLLMAFGAAVTSPVTISVLNLASKPYIDLTLQVMKAFGCEVKHDDYKDFYFSEESGKYTPQTYTVEGDWSGASFLLVAGAIAGPIQVTGLKLSSVQADKAILQALTLAGCDLQISGSKIEIAPAPLTGFQFDATDCPDLFPPLAVLAAYCKGKTVIKGTNRLVHKESNRAITLQQELGKMGVQIALQNNLMIVEGNSKLHGATIDSHHDHRIAMACAVAALKATGTTVIEGAEAVNKSYKTVYNHLFQLGARVKVS